MTQQTHQNTTRTNIVLNTELVQTALRMTGLKTRRELVDYALRELVRHQQQMKLLELKGKIDWEGDLDTMRISQTPEDWA
jgi:Arc/MetJ family transcription regulator